jgi:hypothetical protein
MPVCDALGALLPRVRVARATTPWRRSGAHGSAPHTGMSLKVSDHRLPLGTATTATSPE